MSRNPAEQISRHNLSQKKAESLWGSRTINSGSKLHHADKKSTGVCVQVGVYVVCVCARVFLV